MLHGRRQTALRVAGGAILLLVGVLVYGFSLRLPFFSDDLAHYRWLAWHGFAGIWSSGAGLGHYRPLPFTLWRILLEIQGRHDPLTLHALNLGLHLLNTLMVFGMRAGRPSKSLDMGLAAGLLFLLYPFSYQAVPWVGSFTHPLVTTLLLGALLLYELGARRNSPLLRAASLVLALLAPFAHETGMLAAPLLLLLLLTAEQPLPLKKALRQTGPYWLCAVLGGGAAWLLASKDASPAALDLAARLQSGAYFLQGLGYPVAPLALRLHRLVGNLGAAWATLLVVGPALILWSLLLWRLGRGRLLVLALGWFALAAAPAWAMLDAEYVLAGPRVLYLASVGAALFWAGPLDVCRPERRRSLVGAGLAWLVVLGIAASNWRYIQARVPLYEQVRLAVAQLVRARPSEPGAPVLCINYPIWLALRKPTYPLGHDGVVLVPDFTNVADLMWLHTGEERPVKSVVFHDLLPKEEWTYITPCAGQPVDSGNLQAELRQVKRVIVTSYTEAGIAVYDAGGLEGQGRPRAGDFLADFDGRVGLVAAGWEQAGANLKVEFRWQCWQALPQDTTIFVHLYDEGGKLVAQADGYPVMGTSHPIAWQPGDEWRDVRLLRLPANLAPGRYSLKTGLYPVAGGPRLPATGPAGERLADEAVPIATLTLPF